MTIAVRRVGDVAPAALAFGLLNYAGNVSSEHMRLSFRHHRTRPRANRISLRVWRFVPSGPQWLYTYAGTIDHAVLGNVMQTIRRLTEAVPGEWIVDVLIVGVEHTLLRAMQDGLHAMRGHGVQPCLRHAPHRPAWLRRELAPLDTPPLLH